MTDQEFSALVVETMARAAYECEPEEDLALPGQRPAWVDLSERVRDAYRKQQRAALGSLSTINAEVVQIKHNVHRTVIGGLFDGDWCCILARYVGEPT